MNILVLMRMVADSNADLALAPDGRTIDYDSARMIVNERDLHALEQALLLKERHGGYVTVAALDASGVAEVLWSAMARGADRAIRVTRAGSRASTRGAAALLTGALKGAADILPMDLVLVGCQACDDLDGQLAPVIARGLEMPYLGVVVAVDVDVQEGTATAVKEFEGGRRGEYEIQLPAVLGVHAAERRPRRAALEALHVARRSRPIEVLAAPVATDGPRTEIVRMVLSEPPQARMLQGTSDEVAVALQEILRQRGLPAGGAKPCRRTSG